jgi:methyl-accepting chemotaxis protein
MNQMDQVTQQNAAMVEEATAASHSLAGEAAELARLVGRFKIYGAEDARSAQPKPRRAAAAPPPVAPRKPARAMVAFPANGRQSSVPAEADKGWTEF